MNDKAAKAVVFDLDGLMFNTEDIYELAGTELLKRRNLMFTEMLRRQMMGRRAEEAIRVMIDHHELDDSPADLQDEARQLFLGLLSDHLAPMPGLIDLLDHLKINNIPTAVATSSDRAYLEQVLTQFKLIERFEFLLTAEDVQSGKPHPEIYRTAALRLKIQPESMLVLEDSENGVRAAAAAGAIVIAVPSRHSAEHDFSNATHVVESLSSPMILQHLC
ncbi:HAD family hydrolase [Calycomorphotria hydatis]|uniref:Phosphorylated carbohydrates phosphatase n=1 Tax=Calycomorphotria hydatis TaxID=2528027 RepID=A0A517T9E1_9PLAN|nr:HAD-IA family hydrolase [Calycomorphotria hydatis]QDT64994.1 Phosphorylated carbohydrates phosphatase [Calycomorphotria hydatis]